MVAAPVVGTASAVEGPLADPVEAAAEERKARIIHAAEPATDLFAVDDPLQGEHVRLGLLGQAQGTGSLIPSGPGIKPG